MSMTTLISKLLPFFVTSDKGHVNQVDISSLLGELASLSSSASSLSEPSPLSSSEAGRDGEEATMKTTHDSMSSCYITNPGVHLTQIIIECVKASIHAHKLCHGGLKCHYNRRRRRCRGVWSNGSWRSHQLCSRPPQSELCLAPFDGSYIYGTYYEKMRRLRKGDRKMAKDPLDSQRKNELITGRCIPIDIYKG